MTNIEDRHLILSWLSIRKQRAVTKAWMSRHTIRKTKTRKNNKRKKIVIGCYMSLYDLDLCYMHTTRIRRGKPRYSHPE
jgi:hypothetical protein